MSRCFPGGRGRSCGRLRFSSGLGKRVKTINFTQDFKKLPVSGVASACPPQLSLVLRCVASIKQIMLLNSNNLAVCVEASGVSLSSRLIMSSSWKITHVKGERRELLQ